MNDKVTELRQILNKKKAAEAKKQDAQTHQQNFDPDETISENNPKIKIQYEDEGEPEVEEGDDFSKQIEELQQKCDELTKANQIQKDMYLAKAAEFENYKKRLSKEQEEFAKYANEKLLTEIFPIIDSLEMTLSHSEDIENDPIASGVNLILRQLLQMLKKFGVEEIRGEGEVFDPNLQEAIGTGESEEFEPDHVMQVHRSGFTLNGRVIRAAMVTVCK